jgi:hypothetical protein
MHVILIEKRFALFSICSKTISVYCFVLCCTLSVLLGHGRTDERSNEHERTCGCISSALCRPTVRVFVCVVFGGERIDGNHGRRKQSKDDFWHALIS